MKIYAHRGFSSKFPENTLPAFEACLELGIEGIEIDVQLTGDGQVVIIHDEYLKRLCGVDGFVKDMSYDELSRLRVLESEEAPLLLEDYVELVQDTELVTNVELKTSIFEYPGIEKKVYDLFKAKNQLDRLIISSFNHESLLRFRALDSHIPLAALTASKLIEPWEYLTIHGFDIFHPLYTTVDKETVDKLHERGIGINVWTVNELAGYEQMRDIGVDGVITNHPDLNLEIL